MGPPGGPQRGFLFVPIRSLAERHHPKMVSHLLALGASDRYLRFGYPATNEQVRNYVEYIDFELDEVFGVFNRRHDLVALAHLACEPENPSAARRSAEFGVSVASYARGRGYGSRLFEHAVLRARGRGIDTMVIHALSENAGMLAIVRQAGASIEQAGIDAEARLRLPSEDTAVRVD
jgi:GNAT superfamily N-acetyltransferase